MVGRLTVALALVLGLASTARADAHVVETAHYRLHYEGTRADAEEAGRVLEAAWQGFRAFFGGQPKLAEGERLTVRFYATGAAWAAGIRADGTNPPQGAGGYYWPGTKTSYLYAQPTHYFTRVLLVHEAAHQFHYLTRTRNRNPTAAWYTEGIAEHLSWHRWDGTRLELGVVPGITLKDYPAAALAEISARDFDLGAIVDGGVPASRAVSWALVRFLATGDEGKPLPRFDVFREKMDHGGAATPLFRSYFGRAGRLQPRLQAWLASHQTGWTPVFNEWEQVGPDGFRGRAGVVSACRLKHPPQSLHATVEVPRGLGARAGLLLHWTDNDDYTVLLVSGRGGVRVDRRQGGAWRPLYRGRVALAPGGGEVTLGARRDGDAVVVQVASQEIGRFELPPGPFGLALERSDVSFRDVAWEPAPR